jgi:hypothetical protein
MKVRRIAAFLLLVYVAICVSFILHIHLREPAVGHCKVCQFFDTPGAAVSSITYAPLFSLQELCRSVVRIAAQSEWASPASERAPPRV